MDNIITLQIRGFDIKLKTKPGVFSSKGLDDGTRVLVENMDIKDGTVVADLGCGIGVVGYTAARLNLGGHVHLLDDHLRSVTLAQENKDLNRAKNAEVFLSDIFSAVGGRTYHQILSNPPQQLGNDYLEELTNECFNHLKPGGSLWVVVKENVASFMKKTLEAYFKDVKIEAKGRGHVVLVSYK